jgi:hypothetical protein
MAFQELPNGVPILPHCTWNNDVLMMQKTAPVFPKEVKNPYESRTWVNGKSAVTASVKVGLTVGALQKSTVAQP